MPHAQDVALGAEEYTELVASTLQKIEADLVDQVMLKHPTLAIIRENSSSETGRTLVYNLEAAEDESTGFTDESGSFSTDESDPIVGAAEYDWSSPLISKVRVVWLLLQKNSGKQQLVNLLTAHLNAAKKGHARKIARTIHNLGNAKTPGQFEPFDVLFGNSAANPTVGGITAADADHYWNATRLTIDHGTGAGETENIFEAFRFVENELAVTTGDMAEISHVIAGRSIFEEYVNELDSRARYLLNQGPGDSNSVQTKFKEVWFGNIPIRLDPDMQDDRAYFMDVNRLRMRFLNGNFMKVQPAQPVPGTLDFVTPLASVIATGTNERRNHAVLIRSGPTGLSGLTAYNVKGAHLYGLDPAEEDPDDPTGDTVLVTEDDLEEGKQDEFINDTVSDAVKEVS